MEPQLRISFDKLKEPGRELGTPLDLFIHYNTILLMRIRTSEDRELM